MGSGNSGWVETNELFWGEVERRDRSKCIMCHRPQVFSSLPLLVLNTSFYFLYSDALTSGALLSTEGLSSREWRLQGHSSPLGLTHKCLLCTPALSLLLIGLGILRLKAILEAMCQSWQWSPCHPRSLNASWSTTLSPRRGPGTEQSQVSVYICWMTAAEVGGSWDLKD